MTEEEVKQWLEERGMVMVPKEPSIGLLTSMAIRDDHALAIPGAYDQPFYSNSGITHADRLKSAIRSMRQIYEEVVGSGFYSPEREEYYLQIAGDGI